MAVISTFGVPVDGGVEATLMPKLQYRFRIEFFGMGAPGESGSTVTRNVMSAGRPTLSHEEVVVDAYNSKIYLAGKHTWETIQVVLRDDVDSEVIKKLGAQMSKQVNHAGQTSAFSGEDYKFKMTIATLDGNNSGAEREVDVWDLAGCYITNVAYGELNYATSDVVQVTMTIRFDNAAHLVDGEDQVSRVATIHEAGRATGAGQ